MTTSRSRHAQISHGLLAMTVLLAAACTSRAPNQTDQTDQATVPRQIRWTNFETGSNVKALAVAGHDLWLGLANGIIRYDTRTLDRHVIYTARSTEGGLLSNGVYTIKVDPRGHLWVGTYGGGLSRFDGRQWVTFTPFGGGAAATYGAAWARYGPGQGVGDLWVYDLAFDPEGRLWVATWKGVSVWDGARWATFTEADGLLDKWVYALARDRQGVWWFGTEAGVSRFDGRRWQGFTHAEGLGAEVDPAQPKAYEPQSLHHTNPAKRARGANPNFVIAMAIDHRDQIWFGTWGAGLSRFDGRRWQTYTPADGLGGRFVHALLVDNHGVLWAGTDGGISRWDGRRWQTYTTRDGLLDNNVFSIAVDAKGAKWFGTWRGVSRLEEGS